MGRADSRRPASARAPHRRRSRHRPTRGQGPSDGSPWEKERRSVRAIAVRRGGSCGGATWPSGRPSRLREAGRRGPRASPVPGGRAAALRHGCGRSREPYSSSMATGTGRLVGPTPVPRPWRSTEAPGSGQEPAGVPRPLRPYAGLGRHDGTAAPSARLTSVPTPSAVPKTEENGAGAPRRGGHPRRSVGRRVRRADVSSGRPTSARPWRRRAGPCSRAAPGSPCPAATSCPAWPRPR